MSTNNISAMDTDDGFGRREGRIRPGSREWRLMQECLQERCYQRVQEFGEDCADEAIQQTMEETPVTMWKRGDEWQTNGAEGEMLLRGTVDDPAMDGPGIGCETSETDFRAMETGEERTNRGHDGTGERFHHQLDKIMRDYLGNTRQIADRIVAEVMQSDLRELFRTKLALEIAANMDTGEPQQQPVATIPENELKLELESAARGALVRLFFRRVGPVTKRDGYVIELIEDAGTHFFSRKVAQTIWHDRRRPDAIHRDFRPLWSDVALHIFECVSEGRRVSPTRELSTATNTDPQTTETQPAVSLPKAKQPIPFAWDPKRMKIRKLLYTISLGQSSGRMAFWREAFKGSPVAVFLRNQQAAKLIPVRVRHTGPCPACGKSQPFTSSPRTDCPKCHESPTIEKLADWLISTSKLEAGELVCAKSWVCTNRQCRRILAGEQICTECGSAAKLMDAFIPSKGISVTAGMSDEEEGANIEASMVADPQTEGWPHGATSLVLEEVKGHFEPKLEELLRQIRAKQTADAKIRHLVELMLIRILAESRKEDIEASPSKLTALEVAALFNNLMKTNSIAEIHQDLHQQVWHIVDTLHLGIAPRRGLLVSANNIKVIKHRLKSEWLERMK